MKTRRCPCYESCDHTFGCALQVGHAGLCGPMPPEFDSSRDLRTERMAFLERKREATKADLMMKFEDADWHGVQDCGSDLRDM